MKMYSKICMLAVALVIAAPAWALNPQPEPPFPYKGYEYVLTKIDDVGWRWEIHRRVDGRLPQVLSHGSIRGSHARAVNAARSAIDHLAGTQSSVRSLATPAGSANSTLPLQKAFPPSYSLSYQLTCGAYMMPGGFIYKVAVVNTGPGTVSIGTKIHWVMDVQPGGKYQGDYTFTSQLSPNGRAWVPSYGLPLSFNSAPCTVTVLP